MTTRQTILVAEDEALLRRILIGLFEEAGYRVVAASTGREALERFAETPPDLVVTDIRMPEVDGFELLERLKAIDPDVLVIIMTAFSSVESAVAALRAGAHDYIVKPFVNDDVLQSVRNALRQKELFLENRSLRRELDRSRSYSAIIGVSDAVQTMLGLVGKVAATNASILITGESGTGKELVARAVHFQSQRAKGPFVAVNCGALNENLLEAELFGHEKGAFTGATHAREGLLKAADGGTIFLDEIADMSRPLQAKLLRFLEDGTFTRVGGTQEMSVNVRLVAATNKDIVEAIAAGEFREDLFHRLNVIQFRLPPLREREDDILRLAEHFLKLFSGSMNRTVKRLSRGAQQKLLAHRWPGNVRELRNVIERALILETTAEVQPSNLPDFQIETRLNKVAPAPATVAATGERAIDEIVADFERDLINATLESSAFNLTKSADKLKISRHALRYRMQRLNLTPAEEDTPAPNSKENP